MFPLRIIEPVTIVSNRSDYVIKPRECSGSRHAENDSTVFLMEQTRRWFEINKFIPQAGFFVTTTDGKIYEITDVQYERKRPKTATFITKEVNKHVR